MLRGIQGIKLGPGLFAVMIIDLVTSWCPSAKYVDDLTVMEIVPRSSLSLLNHIVDDIHFFALDNNIKLNPRKCNTMIVDFLQYNSCVPRPIAVGGSQIEQVSCLRVLPGLRTLTM